MTVNKNKIMHLPDDDSAPDNPFRCISDEKTASQTPEEMNSNDSPGAQL